MNRFKKVFHFKKSTAKDAATAVRVSQSISSVDIESVSLEASTDEEEFDTDEERQRIRRTDTDSKPWSARTVRAVSHDLHYPRRESTGRYKNLVLVVVAELNQILNLCLPRYMVALLSNYRYAVSEQRKTTELEQLDLYLSQVQEFLGALRSVRGDEFADIAVRTGRTIALLGSIVEVVGRNAAHEVFVLSFHEQTIAAFGDRYLDALDIDPQFVDYLKHPGRIASSLQSRQSESTVTAIDKSRLVNARIQTDAASYAPSVQLADANVQTDTQSELSVTSRRTRQRVPTHHDPVIPFRSHSGMEKVPGNPHVPQLYERYMELIQNEAETRRDVNELLKKNAEIERLMGVQTDQYTKTINEKMALLNDNQERLALLENTIAALESRYDEVAQKPEKKDGILFLQDVLNLVSDRSRDFAMVCERVTKDVGSRMNKTNQKVVCVSERVRNMKGIVTSQHHDLRRVLEELMQRDEELAGANQEITDLRSDCRFKEEELRTAQADVDMLERRIAMFAECSSKDARMWSLIDQNNKLKREVMDKTGELGKYADVEHTMKALIRKCQELERDSKELESVKKQNTDLLDKISQLESDKSPETPSETRLTEEIKKKNEMVRQLQAGLTAAISDGNELQSDVQELKAQRKLYMESLRRYEAYKKEMDVKIAEKERLLSISEDRVHVLESEITNAAKGCEQYKENLMESEEHCGVLQNTVRHLEQQVVMMERGKMLLSEEVQSIARTSELRQQNLYRFEENAKALEASLAQAQQQMGFLEQNRCMLMEELRKSMETLDAKDRTIAHYEHQVRSLDDSIAELQQHNTESEENSAALKRELDERLAVNEKELTQTKTQAEELRRNIVDMQQERVIQDAQIADLKMKLEAINSAAESRRKRKQELSDDASSMKSKDARLHKDQYVAAKKRIRELEAELYRLQKKPIVLFQETQTESLASDIQQKPSPLQKDVGCSATDSRLIEMEEKIEKLGKDLTDRQNIIRTMEFGKESLLLRISGLQIENQQCEAEVTGLKEKVARLSVNAQNDLDAQNQTAETKVKEALSRLAQKGEQLDYAQRSIDTLLKRQEELNAEVQRLCVLKNQADLRIEQISDHTSREIDELELQIRSLRDQENKTKLEYCDASILTERFETSAVTQTELSFSYGYNFETGQEIRTNIFLEQCHNKDSQTQWPRNPCDVSIQANPETHNKGLQHNSKVKSAVTQTEIIQTEARSSQVDVSERRICSTQTIFKNVKVFPSLDNIPEEECQVISMATSTTDVPCYEIVPAYRNIGEFLDEVAREERGNSASTSRSVSHASQSNSRSVSVSSRCSNGRRENATIGNELHEVCKFLYDTLMKNSGTHAALAQVSTGLDYALSQEDFDQQIGRNFLELINASEPVRSALINEWKDGFYTFYEAFKEMIDARQKGTKKEKKVRDKKPSWVLDKTWENVNDEGSTKEFEDFLVWFASKRTNQAVKIEPATFRISGQKPVLKHRKLTVDQYERLSTFNDYLLVCFSRLAKSSKNLVKLYNPEIPILRKLPSRNCDAKFAYLALSFAKNSNKLKEMVQHEVYEGWETFFYRYEEVLAKRVDELERRRKGKKAKSLSQPGPSGDKPGR